MRFKHKDKTSLFAFLTVCVIIVTYLASTLCVYADDTFDLTSVYNITGSVGGSAGYDGKIAFATSSDDSVTLFSELVSDGLLTCPASYTSYVNSCPNYVVLGGSGSDNRVDLLPLPEDAFIISDVTKTNKFTIFYPNDSQNIGDVVSFRYYDYPSPTGYKGITNFSLTYDSFQEVDSVWYSVLPSNSINYDTILESDVPIYFSSDNYDEISSIEGLTDYNTNHIQSQEEDINNLYFPSCSFDIHSSMKFEQPLSGSDYQLLNRYDGSVSFNANFTDYQNAHPDEFALNLTFKFFFSMHARSASDTSMKVYNYTSSNYTYVIPFTDFKQYGYIQTYTIDKLLNDTNFKSLIDPLLLFEDPSQGSFNLTCSAQITTFNYNNGYDSGKYTKTYDFITGRSNLSNTSLNNNEYPYINDDEPISDNEVNNTTNNSTSNSNTNNLNIYNDNTKTVEEINKNFNTTVNNGQDDTDSELVNNLLDNDTTNGFLGVFNNTFSFVPQEVWTTLYKFFKVFIICLVAFIGIRLCADLL